MGRIFYRVRDTTDNYDMGVTFDTEFEARKYVELMVEVGYTLYAATDFILTRCEVI
jgi:outer membrane protease